MNNLYSSIRGISARWKFLFLIPIFLGLLLLAGSASARQFDPDVPQPDLVITDIWSDGPVVCYQIRNIGLAEVKDAGISGLKVDGVVKATEPVSAGLGIGERLTRCFNFSWNCSQSEDTIDVGADITQGISESNEGNNTHTEIWKCDQTPPQIIQGPYVYDITTTSVKVGWVTDDKSDSTVEYSQSAGVFDKKETDPALETQHDIVLTELLPDTQYQYRVRSVDDFDNEVISKPAFFKTLPAPDVSKPKVGNLDNKQMPGNIVRYRLSVPVEDDQAIERVEFYMDKVLIGTDYSPDDTSSPEYDTEVVPGFLHMTDEQFFTEHDILVQAFDLADNMTAVIADFFPFPEPFDGELEILDPDPGFIYYAPANPVPYGTELELLAYASHFEEDCRFADVPGPHGEYLGCVERERDVDYVEFYIDAELLCTTYPDYVGDFYHECTWGIGGLHPGTYQLYVRAYEGDTYTGRRRDIQIQTGELSLSIDRTVSRLGQVFTIQLTVLNEGTLTAYLDSLSDNLVGFQLIHKSTSTYSVLSTYATSSQVNSVQIDLFESGSLLYDLLPGHHLTVEYKALPILYPDLDMGIYAIGSESVRLDYYKDWRHLYLEPSLPAPVTSEGQSLATAVREARESSDYLIVTNPTNLFDTDPSATDVNALLSAMADLAVVKAGVLGYLTGTPCADTVDDILELWGDGMTGSDDVDNHFLSNGYVLLVGETAIIPAHSRRLDPPWYVDAFIDAVTVSPTDVYYADTADNTIDPELNLGRIVGNNAYELAIPIRTITGVYRHTAGYDFDWSNALIMSGWPESRGGGSDHIDFGAERRAVKDKLDDNGVIVTELDTHLIATRDDAVAQFFALAPGKDIVHLVGHGNRESMDDLVSWDFWSYPDPFGSANPFVYGSSCLTGDYTSDLGFAENVLAKGAGLYLGSTEVSYCCVNKSVANSFYDRWDPGEAAGPVLKSVKRDIGGFHADNWAYGFYEDVWTAEYHLLGDPEYGGDLGLTSAPEIGALAQPVIDTSTQIQISVPQFMTETTELGEDLVSIPNGFYLLMPGNPMVPTYEMVYWLPSGFEVQSVELVSRTEMQSGSGLVLPLFDPQQAGATHAEMLAPQVPSEWFPEFEFGWGVEESLDGTSQLFIRLYPFIYNSATTQFNFYQHYTLAVELVESSTEITLFTTYMDAYQEGNPVPVNLWINRSGPPEDVIVSAGVYRLGSYELVDGLLLEALEGLTGLATFSMVWDIGKTEPGDYYIIAELRDSQGNLLDDQTLPFQIGQVSIEARNLVAPLFFPSGKLVEIGFDFENTGTQIITPTAVIQVSMLGGSIVHELVQEIPSLPPGGIAHIVTQWNTTNASLGDYKAVAYVQYEGQITPPLIGYLTNQLKLYLPVILR
ncbi:MAG: hypothetical protein H6Q38_697 [Chloroflexi bacterium]|nr:hypothetical protein [Chloroflexota bacterium]